MDYVQQASVETIDGLALLLSTSPVMACSATAVMLMTLLARRAQTRGTGAGTVTPRPQAGVNDTST